LKILQFYRSERISNQARILARIIRLDEPIGWGAAAVTRHFFVAKKREASSRQARCWEQAARLRNPMGWAVQRGFGDQHLRALT
jgi:hypothetical protein